MNKKIMDTKIFLYFFMNKFIAFETKFFHLILSIIFDMRIFPAIFLCNKLFFLNI